MSAIEKSYILTIEGWADSTGIIKHCYPSVPDYATPGTQYYASLAEPPAGVTAQWSIEQSKMSMGRWNALFTRTFADVLLAAYLPPATYIHEGALGKVDLNAADTGVTIKQSAVTAGLAIGDIVYSERETWDITNAVADLLTVTRGYGGSTAAIHAAGAGIYATPPTWAGRQVKLYDVDRVGSGAGSENLLRVGYISGEPAQGLHWPMISVVDQFFRVRLIDENLAQYMIAVSQRTEGSPPLAQFGFIDFGESWPAPRFNADGAYFYLPKPKVTIKGTYDATEGWRLQTDPVVTGSWPSIKIGQTEAWRAYEMIYSSVDGTHGTDNFTPFGYDDGADTPSTNPIHIVLNLLLSLDGTNTPGGGAVNYDRGAKLNPDFALGVEYALVDIDDMEVAAAELAGVSASRLWLGGPKGELLTDIFKRLLAPWGYAVGLSRQGVWKVLRVKDVVGVEVVTAINSSHIVRVGEVSHTMAGRAVDSVLIEADPWPDGSSVQTAKIQDIGGERLYPIGHGVQVGAEQVFKNTPYSSDDLVTDTDMYGFVASRMRFLALRSFTVDIVVGPSLFGQLDIGDGVTLHEVFIVNPNTGERLTATDDPITGLVVAVQDDYRTRQDKLTILLMPDQKVASIAPAARVVSYNAGTFTATVEADTYSGDDDAGAFTVDDAVVLLNSRHVLRSDDGQTNPTYVKAIGVNTLQFSQTAGGAAAAFRDSAGPPPAAVSPVATDVITYAHYDAVNAAQKANFAHGADGADPPQTPDLGAADDGPYVYGR